MIDKRVTKEITYTKDDAFDELSDTEIVLNFNSAITKLYPYLVPIHAFCYDPWDNIVEPMYYSMVFNTFSYKYGINLPLNTCHKYDVWDDGSDNNHIECIPKSFPLEVIIDDKTIILSQEDLCEKVLVFSAFGDGVHFLTGSIDIKETKNVTFDLTQVMIVDKNTGRVSEDFNERYTFIKNKDLCYEFVAV